MDVLQKASFFCILFSPFNLWPSSICYTSSSFCINTFLSISPATILDHTYITFCLDYCSNSLTVVSLSNSSWSQSIPLQAANVISQRRNCHWGPLQLLNAKGEYFKLACKVLHDLAPAALSSPISRQSTIHSCNSYGATCALELQALAHASQCLRFLPSTIHLAKTHALFKIPCTCLLGLPLAQIYWSLQLCASSISILCADSIKITV